jgi:serine protease Do
MEPDKTGHTALVYKSSPEKDLALLRIQPGPGVPQKFPALQLAKKVPPPGKECVAIGHPGSGLLWTVRSGEISGIGQWPRDMTELLALRLSASPQQRDELQRLLAKGPQRKIVLSNCGINFGDSGGPLLNAASELIAVTFAMPKKGYEGTAPFAYHVHLDEVKEFLEKRPTEPAVAPPDPWPPGIYQELIDLDGDGMPDTLALSTQRGGPLTGMLLDLRQESKIHGQFGLGSDLRTAWRFSVAIHFQPRLTVFYDTDFDGAIDLILTEKEPRGPVHVRRLANGRWLSEDNVRRPLLDPSLFQDAAARERLTRIIQRLRRPTN